MSEYQLSEAEKRLLGPYMTNTDRSVFALTNLPEVVKGALFSRYSRSALGLRRLFLKEFLEQSPSPEADAPPGLSIERAQEFYDRVLDAYGDDSIGELGGAHVAIENTSIIATKILEDSRIGGSPLEKSTRYVSFAEKQGGDYLFYREPRLMASPHQERYLTVCRALFSGYRDLIKPMMDYIALVMPREKGQSDRAHRRAVRARALDALRGLLPAATLTNVGIFGNGRFFESLLVRLQLCGLGEGARLAEDLQRELGQVIPSFIRRADPEHRHFVGIRAFRGELDSLTRRIAQHAPPPVGAPPGEAVQLVRYEPHAEAHLLAALVFGETDASLETLETWAANLDDGPKATVFRDLAKARKNRRHKLPRALESVSYSFDLVGDYGMYRDLHRHRMLTQQRQPLSTRHGYEIPEEVADAGLDEHYTELLNKAAAAYEAIAADYPTEAQYVVPLAYRIRWSMQINLRALTWLVELRSSPQGHPAYRRMAQGMYRCVQEVHPRLAGLMRFVDLDDYFLGRMATEQCQEDKQQATAGLSRTTETEGKGNSQLAFPGL